MEQPSPPTRSYVAEINRDVEGATPREAAEAMWYNIVTSEGPVVELIDDDGARILVDLEREPGDNDVTFPGSCRRPGAGEPATTGLLISRSQVEEWAGRSLSDEQMRRLVAAVPRSSIPEAIGAIVDNVAADDQEPANRAAPGRRLPSRSEVAERDHRLFGTDPSWFGL